MASPFSVVGSMLLLVSIGCTAATCGTTTCLQATSSIVEGGHVSPDDNGVAAINLLQKAALEQRNQKEKPEAEIATEKVNATKDADGHVPQNTPVIAASADDEAGNNTKPAPEAAIIEHLGKHLNDQIQAELTLDTTVMKDKLLLSVLELLAITSLLGVDRCYMGQACLGAVKGLTCGGLGVWAFIDWIVVICNCLGSWDSIHSFGFNANFYPNTVQPAYILSMVGMILYLAKLICGCGYSYSKKEVEEPSSESKDAEADDGAGKAVEASAAPQPEKQTSREM